jgi:hypothetical protein
MPKHIFAFITVAVAFFVTLARGSNKTESILGVKRCSNYDWMILLTFFMFSAIMTCVAVQIVKKE